MSAAIPYSGYGTVTPNGPTIITLPYTYANLPSVVVGHYNTGSYFPTIVYISSVTTSNFSVAAQVYNNSAWINPQTNVTFTWIATACNVTYVVPSEGGYGQATGVSQGVGVSQGY